MPNLRIATLVVALLSLSVIAFATPITFTFTSHGSATNTAFDSIVSNQGDGSVQILTPNSAWYVMSGVPWVSHWNSGAPSVPGYYQVPNGTIQTFTQSLVLPADFVVTSATMSLLADDTAWAWMNGTNFVTPTNLAPAVNCVAGTPGCVYSTMYTGSVNPSLFHPGTNSLAIDNKQLYSYSLGAAWELEITGESAVPEPSAYLLVGLGLGLLALGVRHRRT